MFYKKPASDEEDEGTLCKAITLALLSNHTATHEFILVFLPVPNFQLVYV